jgi:hypothetical protein
MTKQTFSNGLEHSLFLDKYCLKCVNHRFEPESQTMGCPVEDLHILGDGENENGLIQFKDGVASCLMFLPKNPQKRTLSEIEDLVLKGGLKI